MVASRHLGEGEMGREFLIGAEFHSGEMDGAVEVDGGEAAQP